MQNAVVRHHLNISIANIVGQTSRRINIRIKEQKYTDVNFVENLATNAINTAIRAMQAIQNYIQVMMNEEENEEGNWIYNSKRNNLGNL